MKFQPCKRVLAILVVSMIFTSLNPSAVRADTIGRWSPDARVPGYLDDTFTPFLLADKNRTVHAFASQWIGGMNGKRAIVYREWTLAAGWTRPVDIILNPEEDTLILGAFLDASDRMHIIFSMGEETSAAVYYSAAHAAEADVATAWSLPVMVGPSLSVGSAAILGDDDGNLVMIYSGYRAGSGLYFVTSEDAGETWSEPLPAYLTYDTLLVPYSLRLVMGPNRQMRATWNVVTTVGVDKMLYFANYDLPKKEWSVPIRLDRQIELPEYFGPSYPAMVDDGEEIVIMYNNGNPFASGPVNRGRPVQQVRRSADGGLTWNGPVVPFPYHLGRSGEHALVMDGNGIPHALFVQRIEDLGNGGEYNVIGGVWHSALMDGNWTNPERFVTTYAPHDLRAVVSQGNVLLTVWREDPGLGEHGIWFSYMILDVPEAPVVPLSAAPAAASVLVEPTAPFVLNAPTSLPDSAVDADAPSQWRSNPAFPLVAGVIPVVLVLLGTVAAFRFLTTRRE